MVGEFVVVGTLDTEGYAAGDFDDLPALVGAGLMVGGELTIGLEVGQVCPSGNVVELELPKSPSPATTNSPFACNS